MIRRRYLAMVLAGVSSMGVSTLRAAPANCTLLYTGSTKVIVEDYNSITVTVYRHYIEYCGAVRTRIVEEADRYFARDKSGTRYDGDQDGTVDKWQDPVETNDACAKNFDTGDRLGKKYGGPNPRDHTGVDIQGDIGDWVRNWRKGKVSNVFYNSKCGKGIIVDHGDGTDSWYCHLNDQRARKGHTVLPGEVIGTVGNTGNSSGPHLHLVHRKKDRSKYWEYFMKTDNKPSSSQLNPNGC